MSDLASLVVAGVLGVFGVVADGEAGAEIAPQRAQALAHMVRQDCGSCHGLRLSGGLGPDIRGRAIEGLETRALVEVILDGRPGTAMPAWRPLLTEEEALWIVDYLRAAGSE